MQREYYSWYSNNLQKEINVASYGHYGLTILMFSSNTESYNEIENNGFLDLVEPLLSAGRCRIFSITNLMNECWFDPNKRPFDKSKRHFEFNKFIEEELIQNIYNECGGPTPIITAGADYGGFIAANVFFRRPDLIIGTIALDATYNIEHFSKDYYDENCYFNSPIHYLPNLNDDFWMSYLFSRKHIYLVSGSGENQFPDNTRHIGEILIQKGIRAKVEIWGDDWGHNWNSWAEMFKHFIFTKI